MIVFDCVFPILQSHANSINTIKTNITDTMNIDTPSSEPKSPEKPTFKLQSIQVTFRVSPEMFQAIEDTSRGKNMKSTDLMRLAISKYVSSKPCPRCGSENAPDARFCSTCGQPLTDEAWKGREIEEQRRAEARIRLEDEKLEKMREEHERRFNLLLKRAAENLHERDLVIEELRKTDKEAAKENRDE